MKLKESWNHLSFGDELTFEEGCFLSWFSYFRFPKDCRHGFVSLGDLGKLSWSFYKDASYPFCARHWFEKMRKNPLYQKISVGEYYETMTKDMQYSCCLIKITEKTYFFSLSGTTPYVSGWKENFMTGLQEPIPAQRQALSDLKRILKDYPDISLYLGGHSKGGSEALYAYLSLSEEEKKRIRKVFLIDSPDLSFSMDMTKEDEDKIDKRVPPSSMIGVLFENVADMKQNYRVVSCHAFPPSQHNAFLWRCNRQGKMIFVPDRTKGSKRFSYAFTGWLKHLTREEVLFFNDVVFEKLLRATEVDTLFAFLYHPRYSYRLIRFYLKLRKQDRKRLKQILGKFVIYYREYGKKKK